jgi:FAD dependent oxidoreductase TIGR03364
MISKFDVAVIGAGIAGLAQAWRAAQRGHSVLLVERTSVAQGASVRNFGMIWPIGQPAGELHEIAMRSREFWLELGQNGVLETLECGSIHLAHHADEMNVLEEFRDLGRHDVSLMTPQKVLELAPLANPRGLVGGMHSVSELRVNPRVASACVAKWLAEKLRVACCFNTQITSVEGNVLRAADGRSWQADRIVICSGSDLQTLFPHVLGTSGLKLCKLQMMKSVAQTNLSRLHPHLASGLTLRHYTSFLNCPSLANVKSRVSSESPELDRYGIHVMASPFPGGEVIFGDSHEYDGDISPFDKSEIDELLLRELKKVFVLDDWKIQERWHGIYAKHPQLPIFEAECAPGVHVFVGPGGAGMTMSFGLAERTWKRWEGTSR